MKAVHIIVAFFISYSAICQEIVTLNMSRAYSTEDLTMTIRIPIEEGREFFQLNPASSSFEVIKDNTGFDLLEASGGDINRNNSYTFNNPGYVDYFVNLRSTPSKGSMELHVKGTMIMEYKANGPVTQDLTIKMTDQYSGKATSELGEVRLENSGEVTLNDIVYQVYRVIGDMPITSIKLATPDDSEKTGVGLSDNEIMYQETPSEIDIQVEMAGIEKVELPIDLKFGIGF